MNGNHFGEVSARTAPSLPGGHIRASFALVSSEGLSQRTPGGSGGRGFTLMEVILASVIFLLAAIPIYFSLSQGTRDEVDATKLAMSRKILESFRSEIIANGFKVLADNVAAGGDFAQLGEGLFQKTNEDVLSFQKQFKDFDFRGLARFNATRNTVIEVKGQVTWTDAKSRVHGPEELLFMVVKP